MFRLGSQNRVLDRGVRDPQMIVDSNVCVSKKRNPWVALLCVGVTIEGVASVCVCVLGKESGWRVCVCWSKRVGGVVCVCVLGKRVGGVRCVCVCVCLG